jgi:predicted nucleotidyltransferase
MSCNISSEGFNKPLLKELLKKLTDYFQSIGSDFYIIGATARDIILSGIHNQASARRTADLDIAIAIKDWGKFEQIRIAEILSDMDIEILKLENKLVKQMKLKQGMMQSLLIGKIRLV